MAKRKSPKKAVARKTKSGAKARKTSAAKARKPKVTREPKPPTKFDAKRLHEDVDTYTDAIYAVLTFVNHARWDESARRLRSDIPFGVGRRFTTSAANRLKPSVQVTPDAAVQLNSSAGVIAEAKPGVSRSVEVWKASLKQLEKYDDDLSGWWTEDEKIKSHDIVAIVPLPRVVNFIDTAHAELTTGAVKFDRPLSIVSFTKHSGAESMYVILRLETTKFGTITDPNLHDKLRRAIPVDWKRLLTIYKDKKFIDAEPELVYTLYVLWDFVLSNRAGGKEPEAGQPWVGIDVEVGELTREVQDFYGFRSEGAHAIEVPRVSWIRKALDALVVFELASKESDGHYRIRYRRKRSTDRDTMNYFGKLEAKYRQRLQLAAAKAAPKPLLEIAAAAELPAQAAPVEPSGGGEKSGQ